MSAPAILVFVMEGCGACHDYVPRAARIAHAYRNRGLSSFQIKDMARDKDALRLADRMGVQATPTTFFQSRTGVVKRVGALEDAQIQAHIERIVR